LEKKNLEMLPTFIFVLNISLTELSNLIFFGVFPCVLLIRIFYSLFDGLEFHLSLKLCRKIYSILILVLDLILFVLMSTTTCIDLLFFHYY
jgi:hypothetical protein